MIGSSPQIGVNNGKPVNITYLKPPPGTYFFVFYITGVLWWFLLGKICIRHLCSVDIFWSTDFLHVFFEQSYLGESQLNGGFSPFI